MSRPELQETDVTVAVITGYHSFDVVDFHELFRGLEGVRAYTQHLELFAASPEAVRDSYDVVLFFFAPVETPHDEGLPWWAGKPRAAVEHLGETEQGIIVLHHAVLAYLDWPVWGEIVGIPDRSHGYHPGQTIRVDIANPEHPITKGLTAWEIVDETYTVQDAGEGSDILLTVDHPKSIRTVAWTRRYRKARVFVNVLGHDNEAWSEPNFAEVLARGIRWAAGRL